MSTVVQRRFPIGAEPVESGVHFRLWAPRHKGVEVFLDGSPAIPLHAEGNGYFSGFIDQIGPGALYRFRIDGKGLLLPDPASRFQPEGPHGPSVVVNPNSFRWTDDSWPGINIQGQVLYEMHIGTFTSKGTWTAARELLRDLVDAGITTLEIMPVADFAGDFGWGYDGVNLFAPTRLYGTPDDFRAFVDHAHALGLGVVLDVVYNHLGPDGNYLKHFTDTYFSNRYENEWGEAINFDGEESDGVREFFVANACYWIEEFHLDGLRIDATQQIFDSSPEHILTVINRETRRTAAPRSIVLIAENEPQDARLARPLTIGGYGLDAIWNDDFHHTACVALTGRTEAYYSDYSGTPQEFISAMKWGFLFQGQFYAWQHQPRGTFALDLPPYAFVTYLENHDQVANSLSGARLLQRTSPGEYRALVALMLLGPHTPMLFQGQEYGATTPFLFFSNHHDELARLVQQGRRDFLTQFPSIANSPPEFSAKPHDPATFQRSKLDASERAHNTHWIRFHRDLLKLRREDPVFAAQRCDWIHGAVLGDRAFALRFFGGVHGDRLLLVNLGRDLHLRPMPEPLLAPPGGAQWEVRWSSEHTSYGGSSHPPIKGTGPWKIAGRCAVVLYETRSDD